MNLFQQLDQYCERTDASFWSEPFNFLTNAGFLLAAWLAWRIIKARSLENDPVLKALNFVLVMIGLGSATFHSIATQWAELADVIPIAIFVLIFLYQWPRQIIGLSRTKASLLFLSFFAVSAIMISVFSSIDVGGSEGYFAVILYLSGFGLHQKFFLKNTGHSWLAIAAVCFAISLTFRSIDQAICNSFPLGTHFLWHCLNAMVCFLTIYAMIDSKTRALYP